MLLLLLCHVAKMLKMDSLAVAYGSFGFPVDAQTDRELRLFSLRTDNRVQGQLQVLQEDRLTVWVPEWRSKGTTSKV